MGSIAALLLLLLVFIVSSGESWRTGFWYDGTSRAPEYQYDSLLYANMTVKINRDIHDGPGQNLVSDPNDPSRTLYVGNTMNRQSFDTQFILDLEAAMGLERTRVFVTHVSKGDVHFTWESTSVIVEFIILERDQVKNSSSMTLLESVNKLTNLIQNPNSTLYNTSITKVACDIDLNYGMVLRTWDISLKLTYAIQVVGGDAVKDGYYLNQGGLGACDNYEAYLTPQYCEFERFFEDDVSRALGISYYRVQIMFVKQAAQDAVLVYFRILPPTRTSTEMNVTTAIDYLMDQVATENSPLYNGNVTIRVDPLWGVSNTNPVRRTTAPRFNYKYYEYSPERLSNQKIISVFLTAYDRCKANRRCNWGYVELNQTANAANYYQRLFERGELYETNVFLDFEDWRFGSRGFSWKGTIPPTDGVSLIPAKVAQYSLIRGAHFWPFNFKSLGPDIPCLELERNQGLVLDRSLLDTQIYRQEALVDDIYGRIAWLEENIEWAQMDAHLRSRKDVRRNLTLVQAVYHDWWRNEVQELRELNSSQCSFQICRITFDTSTLQLYGAINATGEVGYTTEGTEVAVFTFNSIYLGPEVDVVLIGQRALTLISKTVAIINNTFHIHPGTLGGMQGGRSVARYAHDKLSDTPQPIPICQLANYCRDGSLTNSSLISNNVNGPGSGNLRINPFVVTTSAQYIPEIQYVTTSARDGQTLAGGFILYFLNYSTPIIPHDASTTLMKNIIEDSLNLVPPKNAPVASLRRGLGTTGLAGVGLVNVSRSRQDTQEGYTWSITFTTAIGNIAQMTATSYLQGLQAKVVTGTYVEGNEIGGSFTLNFQGVNTVPISTDETAENFKAKLLQLPKVATAYVSRLDPTNNCDDGLCPYGPLPSRGLIWTVFITTNASFDNISPTSPTDPRAQMEAPLYRITANYASTMTGIGAQVTITSGLSASPDDMQKIMAVPKPFSLAFGGGGGSYGGLGGQGFGESPVGAVYNDVRVSDLIGGSGGCLGGPPLPFEINALRAVSPGRGGHGGGAIEIIASNDIIIGNFGVLSARGEDGEQTPDGGGGGGSGGAIVLASGGIVINLGTLDVSGGAGGSGGANFPALAGGGGGGGRIAIFGESITNKAIYSLIGGACGVRKSLVIEDVVAVTIRIHSVMIIPLDNARLFFLAELYVNHTLPQTRLIEDVKITTVSFNSTIQSVVELRVVLPINDTTIASSALGGPTTVVGKPYSLSSIQQYLDNTANLNIADVDFIQSRVIHVNQTTWSFTRSFPTICQNNGQSGTLYTEASMTTSMYVGETDGAEGTSRALHFANREETNSTSGSAREAPFALNGPIFPFVPSQPDKVTFYVRLDAVTGESTKSNFGALFSLVSRVEPGLAVSNVMGVFIGYRIMHGANFGSAVDEKAFLKRMVTINDYPTLSRWYKIDIFFNWPKRTYNVSIDNAIATTNAPFKATSVDGIRLSVTRAVDVWYDEIYVGFDNTMNFLCPSINRRGTTTVQPPQRHWSFGEVRGTDSIYTTYKAMTRHYSHIDTVGSIPFDGQGEITNNQDLKVDSADGDYPITQGLLRAGALVYISNSLRSGKTATGVSSTLVSPDGLWYQPPDGNVPGGSGDGRSFWYTEHNHESELTPTLNGGVAVCSSQDMANWRFEGIVFHYANLSDMVYGTQLTPGDSFYVERPKVKFNSNTGQYVMWAVMDHGPRDLAMNAVMASPYEDGPFLFMRSFYPDGNQTRDQVIFVNSQNKAVIARTYFQTVEYVLPDAVMQPTWESVKSDAGVVSYRANYHRSVYASGYDNYHDIYIQRWRGEDKGWNVQCVNKLTGFTRTVVYGTYTPDRTVCEDPVEYKVVIGQGYPVAIETKFVSPDDPTYSWWHASSVPAVRSQPWANNYIDGYCGVRNLDNDLNILDPSLDTFQPVARSNCSNIADNPVHDSLQDKLIGILKVVTKRRAKYLAISELTDDFMDTTGNLNSFEGELLSGDLISLIIEMGQFGLAAGDVIQSTYRAPVRPGDLNTAEDYKYRFKQYITNYNDRALYSLACVLDGICPVNYKRELTAGNY